MPFSMLIKLYSVSGGNFTVCRQYRCSCFVICVPLNIHFCFKTISEENAKTLNSLFKLAVFRLFGRGSALDWGNETDLRLFSYSPNSVKTMYKHLRDIDYCAPFYRRRVYKD